MAGLKKKIFITGSTGFLGRHLILDSVNENFNITILVRDRGKIELNPIYKNITIVEGDIRDVEKYADEICQCDYFVHIAGEKGDISKMQEINADSMLSLLPIVGRNANAKFLFLSSSGVYGIYNHHDKLLTEESECYPDTFYEKTKLLAENHLSAFAKTGKLSYVILRPSNIFGENDESHKLLNFMKKLKAGHFFYINENAMANYVYVKDVTSAIIHFLHKDNFNNQVYNVNSPVLLREMIACIMSELKIIRYPRRLPVRLVQFATFVLGKLPPRFRLLDTGRYLALTNTSQYSVAKLRKEMQHNDSDLLYDGIRNLIMWYRKNNLL